MLGSDFGLTVRLEAHLSRALLVSNALVVDRSQGPNDCLWGPVGIPQVSLNQGGLVLGHPANLTFRSTLSLSTCGNIAFLSHSC